MDNSAPTVPAPGWYATLAEKYQAGISHAFILSLNINDLVTPGTTIRSFLNAALGATCPVIAWYQVPSAPQRGLV